MDEATAKSAIDWLLEASGDNRGELKVNLMGGEPTLRFDLIQKIVPYGKCRARQLGKSLHFGCTTNCTRLSDEMLGFWRRFGMGFHCSIDGTPEIQNMNRPTLGGGPSAPDVERNVPKILAYRPEVMARATITPRSAVAMRQSAEYFARLGFTNMAFKPAMNCQWSKGHLQALESGWRELAELYIDRLASTKPLNIDDFRNGLRSIHSLNGNRGGPCGAGRGLVLIDPRGDVWLCHRFGPHQCGGQFLLGRLGGAFNDRLRAAFLNFNIVADERAGCDRCLSAAICRSWCFPECIEATRSLYNPGPVFCRAVSALFEQVLHLYDHLKSHRPDLLRGVVDAPG